MPKQTFFNLTEDKRNSILDIAIGEFAEHGYNGASISRMVELAGIAKGSFYQYFDDKADLYEHIVVTFIADRKLDTVQEHAPRLKELTLTEFLRVVFKKQFALFSKDKRLLKIGLDLSASHDSPMYHRITAKYQNITGTYFVPFIRHEKDQGELDPNVDEIMLNYMLLSLGNYLINWLLERDVGQLTEEALDEIIDKLHYILSNGVYSVNPPAAGSAVYRAEPSEAEFKWR